MIVALLAAAGPTPALPLEDPDLVDHHMVVGEEVYAHGTYTFTKRITVSSGATLVFHNATILLDQERTGCDPSCAPVVDFQPGATWIVRDSLVTTTEEGLSGLAKWASQGYGVHADVRNSTFEHVDELFFSLPGAAPSAFVGNTFRDSRAAITWLGGGTVTIKDNRFLEMGYAGVHLRDVTGVVTDNAFTGQRESRATGYAITLDTSIVGQAGGLGKGYEVRDNEIRNFSWGIFHRGDQPIEILDNRFEDLSYGVTFPIVARDGWAPDTPRLVTGNDFHNVRNLIYVYPGGNPPEPTLAEIEVHGNNVLDGCRIAYAFFALPSNITVHVDATHNYWGPAGPWFDDDCSVAQGDVTATYDPWASDPFPR